MTNFLSRIAFVSLIIVSPDLIAQQSVTRFRDSSMDFIETGASLDLAVEGPGFFQAELPDGRIGYFRNGNLHASRDGNLVTDKGLPIEPSITLTETYSRITVSPVGEIRLQESNSENGFSVGSIELVRFSNPEGLKYLRAYDVFLETNESGLPISGEPGQDGNGYVLQGFLESDEGSLLPRNVSPIATLSSLTEMLAKVVGEPADASARQAPINKMPESELLPRLLRIEFSIEGKNISTEVTTAIQDYMCSVSSTEEIETAEQSSQERINEEYVLNVSGRITSLESTPQVANLPADLSNIRYLVVCEGSFMLTRRIATGDQGDTSEESSSEDRINFSASIILRNGEESTIVRHKSNNLVIKLDDSSEGNMELTNIPK